MTKRGALAVALAAALPAGLFVRLLLREDADPPGAPSSPPRVPGEDPASEGASRPLGPAPGSASASASASPSPEAGPDRPGRRDPAPEAAPGAPGTSAAPGSGGAGGRDGPAVGGAEGGAVPTESDAANRSLREGLEKARGAIEALDAVREGAEVSTETAPPGAPCIEGRVVDDEGNPVKGGMVRIRASGAPGEPAPKGVIVRLDGRSEFRSPALDAGLAYDVTPLRFEGWLGTTQTGVPADGRTLTLVLRRGGRIDGSVLEEDGSPVRGRVFVSARAHLDAGPGIEGTPGAVASVLVRPDGSFTLRALGEFPFRLRVTGEDYLAPEDAELHRPGERVEIRVTRGVALLGRVEGWKPEDSRRIVLFARQDGRPEVLVSVAPAGSFEVRALRPGAVRIEAAWGDGLRERAPLGAFAAPAADVEVRLPPEAREPAPPK